MNTTIGADVGKYQTRIVSSLVSKHLHPSRIIRYDDAKMTHDLGNRDFLIEYGDHAFYVGEFAKREGKIHIQYKDTSKVHFTTLINLLCALSTVEGNHFNVVLNTPISHKNEKEVNELKKLVSGTHACRINGIEKLITIDRVGVWVEGAAGFFSQPRRGIVQGFDFGSTTTNVFTFEDKYFINNKSHTIPLGMENSDAKTHPAHFMESLYTQLSHDFSPEHATIVLGGGYQMMYRYVKQFYPQAYIADDPIFATAIGLYKLARKHYG